MTYPRMPVLSAGGVKDTSRPAVGQSPLNAVIPTPVGGSGVLGAGGRGSCSATSVSTPVGVPDIQLPCSNVVDADPLLSCCTRFVASWVEGYVTVPVTTALPGSTERI